MKYKNGKSWYDKEGQEWKYQPRIYTDFYCSLTEWAKLGNGKDNFMYQVRSAIVDILGYPDDKRTELEKLKVNRSEGKYKLKNGLIVNKLSFDRGGRRDSLEGEKYSAWIIKNVIKLITHRDAEVEFYSWKGTIDHIEITFPKMNIPNIILLLDIPGGDNSTNDILIKCMNSIYDVLNSKTTEWYDKYLYLYFNNDYDMVFFGGMIYEGYAYGEYSEWADKWQWKDRIFLKTKRKYVGQHNINISYK